MCKFRKYNFFASFFLIFLSLSVSAQTMKNAQNILSASDAIKNPKGDFSTILTVTEFKNGQASDPVILTVFSKKDENSAAYFSLIRCISPKKNLNKTVLKVGKDLWFYDPKGKATIKISPQQRIIGQASNADAITIDFSSDYDATSADEEDILDGDSKQRKAFKLSLSAKTTSAAYSHISLWVDKDDYSPLKAIFYAKSGITLKTAFYRKYQQVLGSLRPTEIVILDGQKKDWVTVLQYGSFLQKKYPSSWFQKEYLPHLDSNLEQ